MQIIFTLKELNGWNHKNQKVNAIFEIDSRQNIIFLLVKQSAKWNKQTAVLYTLDNSNIVHTEE